MTGDVPLLPPSATMNIDGGGRAALGRLSPWNGLYGLWSIMHTCALVLYVVLSFVFSYLSSAQRSPPL